MKKIESLEAELNQAQKDKNELVLLTLRQIKTALINAEIAKKREKLMPEEVLKVLKSEVKKRKDAIELYKRGNRAELAAKEEKEIAIISEYLPPELGEDEIRSKIKIIIDAAGVKGEADMGKIMGQVMKEFKGQADGTVVNRIVKEELAPKN